MTKINKRLLAFIAVAAMIFPYTVAAVDEGGGQQVPQIEKAENTHFGEGTYDVAITVNPSEVIRNADRGLLGKGSGWNTANSYIMENSSSTEFNQQYINLMDDVKSFRLSRTAGAELEFFAWKYAIGPMSERKVPVVDGTNYWALPGALNFGPIEWFKSSMMIDENCEFIVGLNVERDSLENLVDYAEFCLGDETTEWGACRIQYGIKEPINVAAFELGNEVDWGGEHPNYELVNTYIDKSEAVIDAIREQFPDAKFIICGKTYPLEQDLDDISWKYWHQEIAKRIGHKIDYISHHAYYDGQRLAHIEKFLDKMTEEITEIVGDDHIKFAFTEQAKWPDQGDVSGWDSDAMALSGCISTAEFLNRMYTRTDTRLAAWFNFQDAGAWAGIKSNNGRLYLTGPIYMYNMYDEALGEKIVSCHIKSESVFAKREENDCAFTALASTAGDRELTLILTNKSDKMNFNINFDLGGEFTLKSETVFTAPELYSRVLGEETKNIFTTTVTEKDDEKFTSYLMPEKSIVALKLEAKQPFGTDSLGTSEEVVYTGEKEFEDCKYYWGKNEINSLLDAEVVSGDENGDFHPDAYITRAELLKMLSVVLGLDKEIKANIFDDVTDADWFYKSVNNLFAEGFIKGKTNKSFAPYDNITFEELFTIVSRVCRAAGVYEDTELDYLNKFVYYDEISEYAQKPMAFAVKNGYASKMYENRLLRPQNYVSRGEAAVVVYRVMNNIGPIS